MAIELRWAGADDLDRVAEARMQSFAAQRRDAERFRGSVRDPRSADGARMLLAELDDRPIGTATALPMTMWAHGRPLSCQGVAYVGTVRTERRKPAAGLATRIMREILDDARRCGQIVSALIPFRASFYEHFGYGLVERRNEWTIPLHLLPTGEHDYRPATDADSDSEAIAECRQHMVERGQCDIERTPAAWATCARQFDDGFAFVDRPGTGGEARGWAYLTMTQTGRDIVRVSDFCARDRADFVRLLSFLGSLRDQYHAAILQVPVDWSLNWWLSEPQLPHRLVSHPTAALRTITRMQVRILDHAKFLDQARLADDRSGSAVVAVREIEKTTSRFKIEIDAGRVAVRSTRQSPTFECADRVWAAIACGDLDASEAVRMGLATSADARAHTTLDALASRGRPFCQESF